MLASIEKHNLLASKASAIFSKGHKISTGSEIQKKLENIVSEKLEEYLERKGYSQEDKAKYKVTKKDPYLMLNPKRGAKNETLSQRKFEFFWDYFDMDNFVPEQLQNKPVNYLYDALRSFIYQTDEDVNGDLQTGHYLLKRVSLNSHFKGHISVIRLWVYEEKNILGEKVLRYKTVNAYEQGGDEEGIPFKRVRASEGYVLKHQYNTLLVGGVDYSHISEFEGISSTNHYPEITLLHTASPHSKIFLGFLVANYPEFQKPAICQLFIEKVDSEKYPSYEVYMKAKDKGEKDTVIGTRRPDKKELRYLKLVLNDSSHRNILVPEISELIED